MRATFDIQPITTLSSDDVASWSGLQQSDPSAASPYFSHGYAKAVDDVRPGVEVAVWRMGGEAIAFLPIRRSRMGMARPVGGPVDDLHGIICAPGTRLDLEAHRVRAKMQGYAFSAVPYAQCRHGLHGDRGDGNQVIDLSEGFEAWVASRSSVSSNVRRELRKAQRLLDADNVDIFHYESSGNLPEDTLPRLVQLKTLGYGAAGHFDIFALDWPSLLLQRLLDTDTPDARGLVSTLHIDGQRAAISYVMRSSRVMHYWFPAYEAEFSNAKPGLALLLAQTKWAAETGITEFHLGLGDAQYKRQFASWMMPVRQGALALGWASRLAGRAASASFALEARAPRKAARVLAMPAKVARKWERAALAGTLKA